MWPNCGEITSKLLQSYCIHPVFHIIACWTCFELLIPKANQHTYEPKYICDQNWLKFPSLVFETWCSQVFREAQAHSCTHSRTDRSKCSMHMAPFFNAGRGITIKESVLNTSDKCTANYVAHNSTQLVGEILSEACSIRTGVRQGCSFSPLSFIIYDEAIVREICHECVIVTRVGWKIVNMIRYTDDKAVVASSQKGIQEYMNRLNTCLLYTSDAADE